MKITLLTYGSRGDVQPFVALAVGLQKAGHICRLAAPQRFAALVEQNGVDFHPLPGDPAEISARLNNAGRNPLGMARGISQYVFEIVPQVAHAAQQACAEAQLIVHGFLFTAGGHTLACQQGIPDVSVQTFPMFAPTRAFANVAASGLPAGWPSLATHHLFDAVFRYGGANGYRQVRKHHPEITLSKQLAWPFGKSARRPTTPLIFAFSRQVVPPPPEWLSNAELHLSGYFFLKQEDYAPPPALADFLAAGPPPVCLTFGSMVNRRLEEAGVLFLEALRQAGKRVIVLTGWGGWGAKVQNSPEMLMLEAAPHDWLFRRCGLVVHHGGAGTTAAALKSGVPSMVLPLAGDQPFWAQRVDALGVGPHSMRIEKMSLEELQSALAMLETGEVRQRARAVGCALAAEDGVGAAVVLVEGQARLWGEEKET